MPRWRCRSTRTISAGAAASSHFVPSTAAADMPANVAPVDSHAARAIAGRCQLHILGHVHVAEHRSISSTQFTASEGTAVERLTTVTNGSMAAYSAARPTQKGEQRTAECGAGGRISGCGRTIAHTLGDTKKPGPRRDRASSLFDFLEVHTAHAAGRVARGAAAFSGLSATTASVVRNSAAMDAAFCSAERVTLTGSATPASSRSSYSPVGGVQAVTGRQVARPSRRRRRARARR